VLEGEAQLLIDGQPARTVKAGERFAIPAGVVHDAHNTSNAPAKLVGVYVVEKGKRGPTHCMQFFLGASESFLAQ